MLEEIGDQLRARRESLGLELEDIQRETKIRSRYLRAFEEGDGDSLPAHVYARGILRRYCQELGMDSGPLLEQFGAWQAERDEAPLVDGLARTPGTGRITLRPARQPGSARMWIAAATVIFLLLSAGAVYFLIIQPQADLPPEETPLSRDPDEEEEPPMEEEPAEDPEDDPEISEPVLVVTREIGPGNQDITYHVEGVDEILVLLESTGRCWIRVNADGEFVEELTLEPGSSRQWSADASMRIRAGNPAALLLTVNGEQLGVPSEIGPRNLRFSLSD